ncbi:OmpA family protein [Bdellovibrionota bacterium FG-1]
MANAGYQRSTDAIYRELDYRQKIPLSLGANIPLAPRWSVNGEIFGARTLPFNSAQNPSEFYVGARFQASDAVVLHGGASIGAFSDVPSAGYRLLLGLKIEPLSPAHEPVKPTKQNDVLAFSQAQRTIIPPSEIDLKRDILFAHDSSALSPAYKEILDKLANQIITDKDPTQIIEVEGHTNEIGSDSYNLGLSRRRANAVQKYLMSRAVSADQLRVVGYGKRRPKAGSEKLERSVRLTINRRVEFKTHSKN